MVFVAQFIKYLLERIILFSIVKVFKTPPRALAFLKNSLENRIGNESIYTLAYCNYMFSSAVSNSHSIT